MKHTAIAIGLAAALLSLSASLSTALATTQLPVAKADGLVTPQVPLGETLAKKISDTLRARSASQRTAFYQDLNGRGSNVRFRDIDVVLELPSPARIGSGGDGGAELDLYVPSGVQSITPFAVFAAPTDDDSESMGVTLVGYDLGSGAKISRSRLQLELGNQPFLVVDPEGRESMMKFIAETNAKLAELGLGGEVGDPRDSDRSGIAKSAAKDLEDGPGPGRRFSSELHSIRIEKNKGEWHGKAEAYGLTGCWGQDGHLKVNAVPLLGVHWKNHTYVLELDGVFQWYYEPAADVRVWNTSSTCGILFMEKDKGDWTAVVQAVITAAGQIADAAGQPMVAQISGALGQLAGALGAQGLLTNKDDYLDVINSIDALDPDGDIRKWGVSSNIHAHFINEYWGFNAGEAMPDLAVNALVTQNGSFRPGQDISVALSVGNRGWAPVQPWTADFLLVPAGGGAPYKLATGQGPAVAAQANWAHAFALKIPAGLKKIPAGNYSLEIRMHVPDDVDQSNNKAKAIGSTIKILPAHAGGYTTEQVAELIPHYLATVGGSYYSTGTVQTVFEVRNTGGARSGFDAYFWAQHQTTGELRYLAKGSAGELSSGGSYADSINVPLAGLGIGQWRMVMQVAATDGEQSTANNIKFAPGTFSVAAGGVVTEGL